MTTTDQIADIRLTIDETHPEEKQSQFSSGFSYLCNMKKLVALLGLISSGLGIVGIFVPVLPTTPFLLLASWLFLKSSDRLYNWLMNHPQLGPYIKDFMIYKAIPLKAKIISISTLWVSLICCAVFVAKHWALRVMFILIAIGVSIHILSFKTK